MNCIMPCLITALTRSASKKTTRKKNKIRKNKKINGRETQSLNLVNNVKVQSVKSLIVQIFFYLNYTADGYFFIETR